MVRSSAAKSAQGGLGAHGQRHDHEDAEDAAALAAAQVSRRVDDRLQRLLVRADRALAEQVGMAPAVRNEL